MAAVMIAEQPANPRSRFPESRGPERGVQMRGVHGRRVHQRGVHECRVPESRDRGAQEFRLQVVADSSPRIPTARRVTPATFRRRRLGVLIGMVAVVVIAGRAGATLGSESLAAPGRAPSVIRYVARGGDSLWTAAHRLAPGQDPRAVVDALVHARGNGPLMPGEVLRWQR